MANRIFKMTFLLSLFFLLFSFSMHPYHVGSVEINYNNKSKTFEITGQFFTDDLEDAINKKYGMALFFDKDNDHTKMNTLLQKFCSEYLKLKADNQWVKINYLGFEEDRESINIFLESEKIIAPKKVEAAVSLLYNLFDDQINIVHVIVNGKRQSQKMTYPNRYLKKEF